MKNTAFVSHEDCSLHDTGWSHPDHQGRLPAITRAVQRDMVALWEPVQQIEATHATVDDLLLVHTPAYVEQVRAAADEARRAGRTLDLHGVPVSGASWDGATAAVGTALTAVEAVLRGDVRNAFCLARPPGRDAAADAPGGSSLFNTPLIAARHLRQRRDVGRVLVVYWGSSPPKAAANLASRGEGIDLLSFHAAGDEATSIPGAALPRGSDGVLFEAALRTSLDDIAPGQSPDFVILSAGFDILAGEPGGALAVQPDDVYAITLALREWADVRCGGRLVSVLDAGSAERDVARAVVQHLHALAGLPPA
ncbi:MAG TPA: hypothetical protein VFQ45_05115 [Longimicrobium sp.]|nr:hypothetical protein [Longimicrobium sp.]